MGVSLTPHPDFPCQSVSRIEVEIARTGAALTLTYIVSGRIRDLALPSVAAPARADGLWRHTCFEAFVRPEPGEGYTEYNLAPSTQWAAYGFTGYRESMAPADATPRIEVHASDSALTLIALLEPPPGPCRVALSAVIEETGDAKSYWALAHPPGRPDFHHAAGFILTLPMVIP